MRLLAAVGNPSSDISYEGTVEIGGRQAHHLRLVAPDGVPDASNQLKDLRTLEVFIDASTFLVAKTQDTIHGDENMGEQYSRELFFSDYRTVSGVLIPFGVSETHHLCGTPTENGSAG